MGADLCPPHPSPSPLSDKLQLRPETPKYIWVVEDNRDKARRLWRGQDTIWFPREEITTLGEEAGSMNSTEHGSFNRSCTGMSHWGQGVPHAWRLTEGG